MELRKKGKGWEGDWEMMVVGRWEGWEREVSGEWEKMRGDRMVVDWRGMVGDGVEGLMEVLK